MRISDWSSDVCSSDLNSLAAALSELSWVEGSDELYRTTLSAIESLSSIRKSRSKREVYREDSRGAKLKSLENSIATLDHRQNKAVIETVDRSEKRSEGKECVKTCRARWWPYI